jgi:riboflavin kinase/FMN adenylyltransferase
MITLSTLYELPETLKGGVIAIGNFDGVHQGHGALLSLAREKAEAEKRPFGVLTFEPHPRRLFRPDEPPGRITPIDVKHWRLGLTGADFVCALTFDWNFASQSAEHFVTDILKKGLGAHHVVVGHDFRFGQLRAGTPDLITFHDIGVRLCDEFLDPDGQKIASSTIRQKLRIGDLDTAHQLLGWSWEIWGDVVRGDRRGHDLGYPTANILLKDTLHPAYGVYAARVQIEGESLWRPSAVNIGIRPMFELKEGQVEAHILNFPDRDIYGRRLKIQPVKRLRSEAKFNSLDDLKHQMAKDCAQSLKLLAE